MTREEFEGVVAHVFERLPDKFREAVDNVGIVVEDYPDEELVRQLSLRSKHQLYGLYQGIPLTKRGSWYGMTPVSPDRISLYQKNIEAGSRDDDEISRRIYDVLIHEIGHYFGMNEEEIRSAGY
jgi:predicted Zn-dependent protease with MMP-like domain